MEQTGFFHILSDQFRLRALALIRTEGALCVCELVHALKIAQPNISRHLATMRAAGLVVTRRQAQWVFYALNPDLPGWQQDVLQAAMEGLKHEAIIEQDRKRLANMPKRPDRCAITVNEDR